MPRWSMDGSLTLDQSYGKELMNIFNFFEAEFKAIFLAIAMVCGALSFLTLYSSSPKTTSNDPKIAETSAS